MKAVMYGAGNIGRGFIGALLSQMGYEVVFIDTNLEIVNTMNQEKRYPQEIVGEKGHTIWIEGIRAVNGMDTQAVAQEIATADIMATSVGVNVLPKIIPIIVKGLSLRWDNYPNSILDILICENLMDADLIIKQLLTKEMPRKYKEHLDHNLGLVETAIGRMVPIMTEEMKRGDSLRICVEEYDFLPVDKAAFKGSIPNYPKIIAFSPFHFYLERKLYIHNMAHAMTAFLAQLQNITYIHDAISNTDLFHLVQGAMMESAISLSKKYNIAYWELQPHIDDILFRFRNKQLLDTVERVGREPERKLNENDRLVGAARLCESQNILPIYISLGIASALYSITNSDVSLILKAICHIQKGEPLYCRIMEFYGLLVLKSDYGILKKVIDHMYQNKRINIV